ncbi:tyrosine-type recombinase/integrase [Paraburkholderia unamae]|uniref:tyrosine-type recombinase/integrase n=1 Tax=Paraburkholderia unamae TaxID=219649 RepID=UPI001CC5A802|nr:site-specific integrase [Paraburkholderia unamae]
MRLPSDRGICFVGKTVGKICSQTLSEGALQKLTAADHGRILNDGTGLSGKVHAGSKGVAVHFRYRYRFEGKAREAALGAWPRDALDVVRERLEEIRLRVARGSDPVGQRQAVTAKIELEQAQVARQQREVVAREREHAEQQLTLRDLFEAWFSEAMAENTARSAQNVRYIFNHLLAHAGDVRVSDVRPEHIRKVAKAQIEAGKVPTAIAVHMYAVALFTWAGRRKPWRQLFEVNPAEEVDIDRLVPPDHQSWSERVLADGEIIELRSRFAAIRSAFEFRIGSRRGLAMPVSREQELAVWLMLATLMRINEICAARWEHIDLPQGTWQIPSAQTKNRRSFTIQLSGFALRLLRELHTLTGSRVHVLPHPEDAQKPCTPSVLQGAISGRQSWGRRTKRTISEATARSLILPGGLWSCHDLRRTGATIMQVCGFDEGIIERCLNHSIATQARRKNLNWTLLRTYQRYDYAKEMRAAWHALGEYLENLDGVLTQIAGPGEIVVANDASMAGSSRRDAA